MPGDLPRLATGELEPLFAQRAIQPPRQAFHQLGELGPCYGSLQIVVGRFRSGEEEVAAQGVVEDVGVLGDDGDEVAQVVLSVFAEVVGAEPDSDGRA